MCLNQLIVLAGDLLPGSACSPLCIHKLSYTKLRVKTNKTFKRGTETAKKWGNEKLKMTSKLFQHYSLNHIGRLSFGLIRLQINLILLSVFSSVSAILFLAFGVNCDVFESADSSCRGPAAPVRLSPSLGRGRAHLLNTPAQGTAVQCLPVRSLWTALDSHNSSQKISSVHTAFFSSSVSVACENKAPETMWGIRIRMFLGLPDPHPDPLVTSTDPVPYSSVTKKDSKKNLDFYCFVTSLWLSIFEEWCKCTSVPNPHHPDPYVFGPPGSTFGSVSQRYGSEDRILTKVSRIPNTARNLQFWCGIPSKL